MWARAVALGPVVLLSGVVSHVTADGLLPGPGVLVVLLAVCTAVSAVLLRTRASALRLVALLVGGQGLTHLLLSAGAGHTGSGATTTVAAGGSPAAGSALHAAADEGGRRVGSLSDHFEAATAAGGRAAEVAPLGAAPGGLGSSVGHLADHALAQGPLMLVAHLLGAVALGLWLALGESALWGLLVLAAVQVRLALVADGCARPLRASLHGAMDAARRLPVPAPLHLPLPDSLPHRLVARRGPPLLLAA